MNQIRKSTDREKVWEYVIYIFNQETNDIHKRMHPEAYEQMLKFLFEEAFKEFKIWDSPKIDVLELWDKVKAKIMSLIKEQNLHNR